MNKQTLKMAAAFLTGAVAGAAGVYKVLYGYFEKKETEEVQQLNDQYLETMREMQKEIDQYKYAPPKPIEIITDGDTTTVNVSKKKKSKKTEEAAVVEEKPQSFKEDYTQYTKTVVEPKEDAMEAPAKPAGPKIVSSDVYYENSSYEHYEWTWLSNSELMVDEDEEIVTHPEDYIDKILTEVGTSNDDSVDSVVYVQNDAYGWMIQITINTVDDYDSFTSLMRS